MEVVIFESHVLIHAVLQIDSKRLGQKRFMLHNFIVSVLREHDGSHREGNKCRVFLLLPIHSHSLSILPYHVQRSWVEPLVVG